jgi:hypothetical protein
MKTNYVYYSYEEWGRGYIGVKFNSDPETDGYYGSYSDKTFSPTQKIVLGCFATKKEALEAEVTLHLFFQVDKNPHFANHSRQANSRFFYDHSGRKHSEETIRKIGESNRKVMLGITGPDHNRWGKKHSEETKEKIRQKALGRKHTEETKKRLCKRKPGRENQVGEKAPSFGLRWWVNKHGERIFLPEGQKPEGDGWKRGMKWKD